MLSVIGISFNLIIVRVDRGIAIGGTYDEPTIHTRIQFSEPDRRTSSDESGDQSLEIDKEDKQKISRRPL